MAPRRGPAAHRVSVLLLVMLMVHIGINGPCQGTPGETAILQGWLKQIQDPRASLRDWVSSAVSPCDWTGIECDSQSSRVWQIDLSDMGLSGAVSPVLGQLQELALFNVSKNNFSGSLPSEICSWKNLLVFGLRNNSIAGPIPSCLSSGLRQLRVLDFSSNPFSSLPPSIEMFPQLSSLIFEECALNGTIASTVGNMTTLTSLYLGGNQLTGFIPPELSQLWRLKRLHLGHNNLTGQIPPTLGLMGSLRYLNLAGNNLAGTIPSTLWSLRNLERVHLSSNSLTGAVPPEIANAHNLITLDISDNSLSGNIAQEVGGMKSLEVLNLTKNELVGQIPRSLSTLAGLRVLSLSLNRLTGSIPPGLGVRSNISTLDLSSNELVDYIPHGLCSLGCLSILDLSSNFLYDSVPVDLQSCSSLQRFSVANNGLSGTLEGIGVLPLLRYLDVSSNKMSGTLESAQFSNLSASLVELYLHDNQFIGTLPESIGLIPNLGKLDVSGNNLSGEIPPKLGNCPRLSQMILAGNSFSGSIPREICNSKQLKVINLSWNALTGTVPPQFGSMVAIEGLDLSHNQLNGSIPTELADCSYLRSLDLSYNNFSGPVPGEGVFQTISNISLTGNKYLCGGLHKFHLPLCTDEESISTGVKILTVVLVGLSVLNFATACWWGGRNSGLQAGSPNSGEGTAVAAAGTKMEAENSSIGDPKPESLGVEGELDLELRIFHRGRIETLVDLEPPDESKEAPLLAYDSLLSTSASSLSLWRPPPPIGNWKVVSLVPELNLTGNEMLQTSGSGKLIGARSVEVYAGVAENGLEYVVERQLRPVKGTNLSAFLRKLGQCHHPHLVKVLGYCLGGDDSLVAVVYEQMAGGNLRDAIRSGRLSRSPQKWSCRFDIALGIVRAVHYLHENQPNFATPMHYKITSSEVLLDQRMKAYLSARVDLDSKLNLDSMTSSSDKIFSNSCTDGTDVYDLGVLLLEILSGRPAKSLNGMMTIVDWFYQCLEMQSGIEDMLDATLGRRFSAKDFNQIDALFALTSRCLDRRPEQRPGLDEVLMSLLTISKPSGAGDQGAPICLSRPSRQCLGSASSRSTS